MKAKRMNLCINSYLYEDLREEAEEMCISPNNMLILILKERYGNDLEPDYIKELENLKKDAMDQKGEFTLNDLPSFVSIDERLKESGFLESPAQVKAKLGRMFLDAVRKGFTPGVRMVFVEGPDGIFRQKKINRALVYSFY